MTVTEPARAKLNLSLDVTGKLPGGYHSLRMVMESVTLCDDAEVTLRTDGEVTLRCSLPWLPGDSRNHAVIAAQEFFTELGECPGADIRLNKRIPVGAGMAGGSTDAAAVLRALNRLTGRPFDADKLREIGLRVGSDVPYCIEGGSALAEGRGEILTGLPLPPKCSVIIAKPGFSISTAELFGLVDTRRSHTRPDIPGQIKALESGDLAGTARRMYNVFEEVLPRRYGEIAVLRAALIDGGAISAVMTGTGSAVFGLFESEKETRRTAEQLRTRCRDCFVTEFAPKSEV